MGLRDYELPTETVPINDKVSFTVRGISFEDITKLVNKHGPVLVLAYGKFTEMKGKHDLRPETLGLLVQSIITEFPDAVADMIAISAEEPGEAAKIRKLPIGVQFDAIEKIIRLTFTGEGDLKKLVEIVTRMAVGVKANVESLTATTSVSGGGAFASR